MSTSDDTVARLARADFVHFFAAVRQGQQPFAWQERLLDHLVDHGSWPDRISAPTGAGKTAVIDVHVYATALSAAGLAPRLPRRLSLVVNRRMVVDSHADHAQHVAAALTETTEGDHPTLRAVAYWLNTLAAHDDDGQVDAPLLTAVLRGGIPRQSEWRVEPERCAILTCTPDMWGSRLLLRGYGTSLRARPQEAGLLALDSVVVIDEAHLARQLLRTARDVRRFTLADAALIGVPPLNVVDTTATPEVGAEAQTSVGVVADDLAPDSPLSARLTRPKPLRLHPLAEWPARSNGSSSMAARAAAEVKAVLDMTRSVSAAAQRSHTVGCVMNRVEDAAAVAEDLRSTYGLRVALLTGRMRPIDRDQLRQDHPGLLEVSGSDHIDVLVATQTIEVGVDVDLAGLVTELAPGTALAQRAGRVNRLGLRPYAPIVVLTPQHALDATKPLTGYPYLAEDLNRAHGWLVSIADTPDGLTPWAVARPAVDIPAERRRRDTYQPLSWWDAQLLARTSDHGHAEPDLALWLADDLDDPRTYSIVFRTLTHSEVAASDEDLVEMLRLTRPEPHEIVELRRGATSKLLKEYFAAGQHHHRAAPVLRYKGSDPDAEDAVLSLATVLDSYATDPEDMLPLLRDGDVVVLDSRLIRSATLARTTWQAQGTDDGPAAVDAFDRRILRGAASSTGPSVLRLGHLSPLDSPQYLEVVDWYRDEVQGEDSEDGASLSAALASRLRELVPTAGEAFATPLTEMADLLVSDSDGVVVSGLFPDDDDDPYGTRSLVITHHRRPAPNDPLLSTAGREDAVLLDVHQLAVGRRARLSAERLGLPTVLATALQAAGDHHDDGKDDRRFQIETLGNAHPDERTLAKSGRRSSTGRRLSEKELVARTASGILPRGWRHEQLSALRMQLLAEPPADLDLVTRLVGTSHGSGRPMFPHSSRELLSDVPSSVAEDLFDHGGWEELVETTQRRYGVWGCAYLEALLRAADIRVSREGR